MRTLLFLPVFLLMFIVSVGSSYACEKGDHVAVGDLLVGHAWARESIGGAKAGAAYFIIKNKGGLADKLLSVSTKSAGMSAVHTHIKDGGVMKMRPVPDLTIPPYNTVMLRPGGLHIMLMKLVEPLKAGTSVKLTLNFEKAGSITLDVPVIAKSDEMGKMHHDKNCPLMGDGDGEMMNHGDMNQ